MNRIRMIAVVLGVAATQPCFGQFTIQSFGPATWNADPAIIDATTGMVGATFESFEDSSLDPNLSVSYNSNPPASDITYDSMKDPRWDGNVGFSLVVPGTPVTTCMAQRLEIHLSQPSQRIGFGISLMEIGPGGPSPNPALLINGQEIVDFIDLPNYSNGFLERNVYVVVTAAPGTSISSFGIDNPNNCDRVMMDRIGWFACGAGQDCDNNGVPDECDLARVISVSIPDDSMALLCRPLFHDWWAVSAQQGSNLEAYFGIGAILNPVIFPGPPVELNYCMHDNVMVSPNVPDPTRAVVTYEFTFPIVVSQLEIINHANGISRIEGFVGDSLNSLVSIGSVYGPLGDVPNAYQFPEQQPYVFVFNNSTPGKFFRFIVRKTSLDIGYAMYRAFPKGPSGLRLFGVATECNDNGIPDECELDGNDCNNNYVPDDCELVGQDCNGNNIPDSCDIASSTSYDCNQDQIPDECQPVLDADGDGIQDGCDNCPMVINPDQANNDFDAFGNACDNCPNTFDLSQTDSDSDGLGDLCDNCPGVVNPGQEDCDNDGYGDACGCSAERGDMNGDGLVNALDTQLFVERLLRP